jgi:spermidine synthase
MIRWELLDETTVPGGGALRLLRRDKEFSIRLGVTELMNSRLGGSEKALGTLSCRRIAGRPAQAVLIGGLGIGFTLRAALAALSPDARVVVAELVPAVVDWARGPMAEIFAGSLDDPRVEIRVADVGAVLRSATAAYDAILLDVDNGPEGLSRAGNDKLYTPEGLAAARGALRPNGLLAIWSAEPNARFQARLKRSGFDVEEARLRATESGRGSRHIVWFATRREGS